MAEAVTTRPEARRSSNVGFTPLEKTWVITPGTKRRCSSRVHTGTSRSPAASRAPRLTRRVPPVVGSMAAIIVSAVRQPDSRRSASIGRLSARISRLRDSWLRAITGHSSSRARILRPREISDTSTWRFSALERPVISWR